MLNWKTFYLIAGILMAITFVANLWNFVHTFKLLTIASKVAVVCGTLLFNLLLAIIFLGMWKVIPKMPTINNPDLDNLIKEISEKEINQLKGGNEKNGKGNT